MPLPTLHELQKFYSYDPETGHICRHAKPKFSRAKLGVVDGKSQEGYIIVCHGNEKFKAHRMAFLFINGQWPITEIDHVDGVRHNNKWKNLRLATRMQNRQNSRTPKNNTSGHRGVSRYRQFWKVQAQINGKKHFIGHFLDLSEAVAAHEDFIKAAHGPFYRPPTPLLTSS